MSAGDIVASLNRVEALLTGAMFAEGEAEDFGGRLLRSALPLIQRVHDEMRLCTSEANVRALDLVYDLQGVVKGAAALAASDGCPSRALLVDRADGLLELVTEQMDIPNFCPAAVDHGDDDFARGRDLAAAMLRAGEALWDTDAAAERRWHREGRVQHRFTTSYILQLLEDPELIEGFSAVLSARLGTGDAIPASTFFGLSFAEFEAGTPGADGTYVDESALGSGPASQRTALACLRGNHEHL